MLSAGLLSGRGGRDSLRRILGQFFGRSIIHTDLSDELKERAQPHDQEATQEMVGSAKAFSGTVATRGWRTGLGRNMYYAAAAAISPKKESENKQVWAVMRPTGLRHDSIIKAITVRTDMDGQCCG